MSEILNYKDLTPEKLKELGDVYWGPEGEEHYTAQDPDEAIHDILDGYEPPEFAAEVEIIGVKPIPLTAEKIGWDWFLEHILETLDEDYADPDGGMTEPTVNMVAKAKELAEAIAKEYPVWTCKEVVRVTLEDVLGWVKQHEPEWLEDVPQK